MASKSERKIVINETNQEMPSTKILETFAPSLALVLKLRSVHNLYLLDEVDEATKRDVNWILWPPPPGSSFL